MKKVICCSVSELPELLEHDTHYFSLYSTSKRKGVGHIACRFREDMRRLRITPSIPVWDFMTFSLSVAAADKAVARRSSADGWTRMIELIISLNQPDIWNSIADELEDLLRYLTGDFWTLRFHKGGEKFFVPRSSSDSDADCISLLSGGVDSLVGAIDLVASGRRPIFVSQIVRGDSDVQKRIASALGGKDRHYQWSCNIRHHGTSETSTRARSIVFFGLAALVSSVIPSSRSNPVKIYVPENGFISLNVPLGPGRMGSLSTKTTHPVYLNGLQSIWQKLGINARFDLPYIDKTKGELLLGCRDQDLMGRLIYSSTSCGRYQRKLIHCGVCVPCLIRRAAFLRAGLSDETERGYRFFEVLSANSPDVVSAATAYIKYQSYGMQRFIGGSLSFATTDERTVYEGVTERGLNELGQFLQDEGVL